MLETGLGASTQPPSAQHGGLAIPCWGTDGLLGLSAAGEGAWGPPGSSCRHHGGRVVEPHSTLPGLQAAVGQRIATLQHPLGCIRDAALLLTLLLHSLNPHISTPLYTYGDKKTLCVCGSTEGGGPQAKLHSAGQLPAAFGMATPRGCRQRVGKDQTSWGEASVWPRGGVGTAQGPRQWPPALLPPPPLHVLAGILPGWFYCRAWPNPAQGQQLALRANCCMAAARTAISTRRAACPGPVPTRS